ncbi:hypothetical protein NOR_04043 [Metarhizium rileyi]|uniref:Uncharacterized protein n=1 Tax=Metarhizium rileyi (strain RCEF 4871) TaxID=1649241 RepID=A0A167ERR9_METRR|nr:hypothetical protein NOR_04043 [Metarhizium rileyi RCEF 4871]
MSFYFQPPIFAVVSTPYVQPVVLAPPPTVVPSSYTILQSVPVPRVVYTPAMMAVYTPTPVVSPAASPAVHGPDLRVSIIYYGHEPGRREPWCRGAETAYTVVPTGSRLREDIARFARAHRLAADGWPVARLLLVASGSVGPVIASGLGPVLTDGMEQVLELPRLGDVPEEEVRRALEASRVEGREVYLTVCMDGCEGVAGPDDATASTAVSRGHLGETPSPEAQVNGERDEAQSD